MIVFFQQLRRLALVYKSMKVMLQKQPSRNFHKIHRKTPVPESLNFVKCLGTPFLQNTSGRLLLMLMLHVSIKAFDLLQQHKKVIVNSDYHNS